MTTSNKNAQEFIKRIEANRYREFGGQYHTAYVPVSEAKEVKEQVAEWANENNINFRWETIFGAVVNGDKELGFRIKK